ncbi:MAG: DUF21 domain-containing protein [Candidatus Eisenbacteria bacterium]|nr:DUF21 domain-containing protein [Candidatus Latescibacterota bacterium]MBD3301373.1 DUF21 domain-containing protein [Candidatus Eisenbacteria bacterium]
MNATSVHLLLFLACLVGSALFSGTELSLLVSDRFRIRSLAKARRTAAELTLDILNRRDKVLVTILIASTLVNTAAAALATSVMEGIFSQSAATTTATTILVTVIILVFGEIVPKNVGRAHPESIMMSASRPLFALDLLFLPISSVAGGLVNLVLRAFGGRRSTIVTREDLKVLVQDVHGETGPLRQEKRMLQSILELGQTTAREVMVPMPSVVSIEREASADLFRAILKRRGYTRIPVYERRVDRIVGVVHVFDVLLDPDPDEGIEPHVREITFVPETKRIDRLMVEMQRRGESMVVVVNEFGSCTGIVTMEDIVEEIMGEIADEHEVGVKRIRALSDGVYIVDGLTDIDDLNEELDLDLPKLRYDTVGGLVMRRLGRIPREGDRFELAEISFEVVEVYPYGVRTVKLTLDPQREDSR